MPTEEKIFLENLSAVKALVVSHGNRRAIVVDVKLPTGERERLIEWAQGVSGVAMEFYPVKKGLSGSGSSMKEAL